VVPSLDVQAQAWFAERPRLRFAALGARVNEPALDRRPFGVEAGWLPAEEHEDLALGYLELNRAAFPRLPLPRWALSDLYLMPGAIGLLLDGDAIQAAYVAAPSVVPGRFVGVSLLSVVPGLGAWVKTLTLRMLRARVVHGVAQWANPAVRAHTRLGPLRVLGRVPGGHDLGDASFAYETVLDEATWAAAMARALTVPVRGRVAVDDVAALRALLDRAGAGEDVRIAPPGLDAGHVLLA